MSEEVGIKVCLPTGDGRCMTCVSSVGTSLGTQIQMQTYCSDVHVLSASCSDEEVNTDTAFHHLTRYFPPSRMIGLEELLLGFDAMKIILVSKEKSTRTPRWEACHGADDLASCCGQ